MRVIIRELINEYIAGADTIHKLFVSYFGICDPVRAYKINILPKEGYLDGNGKVKYLLHGVGCRVLIDGHFMIDYDYGPNLRHDGFDFYRLLEFAKNKEKYIELVNSDFEKEYKELIQMKEIVCPNWHPSTHLFYLSKNI